MKVGFDLDGVIADIDIAFWTFIDEIVNNEEVRERLKEIIFATAKLRMHPREFLHQDDEYIIITGRSEKFRILTTRWLRQYGINCNLFMKEKDISINEIGGIDKYHDLMIEVKAKNINSEKLDVFFEDSPNVVIKLRVLCPNTKVIQVGGRLK